MNRKRNFVRRVFFCSCARGVTGVTLGAAQTRKGSALDPPRDLVPLDTHLLPRFWTDRLGFSTDCSGIVYNSAQI